MKKIYKLGLSISVVTLPIITFIACSTVKEDGQWATSVKMAMNKSWYEDKSGSEEKLNQFLTVFKSKFTELKNKDEKTKNLADVEFSFQGSKEDHNLNIQDLQSSTVDFAITNSSSVANANPQNLASKEILPMLQTITTAFSFDTDDKAIETTEDHKQILTKMQIAFDKKPFMQWDKIVEKWTGARWDFLYDTLKNVDFYRGVVTIVGTEIKRTEIRKAWDEKDWNTFRNFGIIHKSSFNLHEKMLKKHFNLAENTFTTLSEDQLSNTAKYSKDSRWKLGQVANFAIAFDDEASFAWEKNTNVDATDLSIKFTPKEGEKIEFIALTEKRKYDIGSFRKSFNTEQAKLITQTFIELAKEGKDTYGPLVGYNGYAFFKK